MKSAEGRNEPDRLLGFMMISLGCIAVGGLVMIGRDGVTFSGVVMLSNLNFGAMLRVRGRHRGFRM